MATLCGHRYCGNEDIMALVYPVITNHVTKKRNNIIGRSPLWQVTSLASLVAIGTVAVKILDFRLSRNLTRLGDQRVM